MHKLLSFNYIYLVPLTLSTLASFRAFRLASVNYLRLFSLFLIVSLTVEGFAISWKWGLHQTPMWHFPPSNLFIYNGFTIIRVAFYLVLYYQVLRSSVIKKIISYTGPAMVILSLVNYLWVQSPVLLNTYTLVILHFTVILLSLIYFSETLRSDRPVRLTRDPLVWISLGNFLYYTGTLPFFLFMNYLSKANLSLAIALLHINLLLNFTMFTFYFIAFLCKPQLQK